MGFNKKLPITFKIPIQTNLLRNKRLICEHNSRKMELNEENLQVLSNYLQQTMSPEITIRRPAEDYLRTFEGQRGYAMLLLALLGVDRQVGNDIKLAAAIAFKNFIKRNWKVVRL